MSKKRNHKLLNKKVCICGSAIAIAGVTAGIFGGVAMNTEIKEPVVINDITKVEEPVQQEQTIETEVMEPIEQQIEHIVSQETIKTELQTIVQKPVVVKPQNNSLIIYSKPTSLNKPHNQNNQIDGNKPVIEEPNSTEKPILPLPEKEEDKVEQEEKPGDNNTENIIDNDNLNTDESILEEEDKPAPPVPNIPNDNDSPTEPNNNNQDNDINIDGSEQEEEIVIPEEPGIPDENIPDEDQQQESIPTEYLNALDSAQKYSDITHLSQSKIYKQLQKYDKYSIEAIQYAFNNMVVDWNENALKKAKDYDTISYLSKAKLYDQLSYEEFTYTQMEYAINNNDADWNENALKTAYDYDKISHLSKNRLYEQLISQYGERFLAEEAQYAIDNINANWNENALKTAKQYLLSGIQIDNIYDQLIYDDFTPEEAQFAMDNLN